MITISANSLSGINAAQTALDASAHNVANQATPGFKRQEVVRTEAEGGGVQVTVTQAASRPPVTPQQNAAQTTPPADISTADLAEMLKSKNMLLANLSVFRADNLMGGKLLDVKG
jgi:flagellar hook-associated protein FlgK